MCYKKDAHEHYLEKIKDIKKEIRDEKEKQAKLNAGVCFLMFKDHDVIKDFMYNDVSYWRELIRRSMLQQVDIDRLNMNRWKFIQAPPETDIIWEAIHKDSIWSFLKTLVLYVLLIAFSIFLLTPLILI